MKTALRFLAGCAALLALAQTPGQQIDDANARVRRVTTPYTLHALEKYGAAWIALDDRAMIGTRKLKAGEAETVRPGATLEFTSGEDGVASLLIIDVKTATHPVSVNTVVLGPGKEFRDQNYRYDTILAAVSPLQLRDVRNLSEGIFWRSGEPEMVNLEAGKAQWITAGMHRLKNLSRVQVKFVMVEW